MQTVLISGGSGLVGKQLSKKLAQRGYHVAILSRSASSNGGIKHFRWDIEKGYIDPVAIEKADVVIHLAGANIGEKRWTKQRKQEIVESRVKSGQLLFNHFSKRKKPLKAFISASAVGYYGAITNEKIYTEEESAHTDFLGETCRQWEAAANHFQDAGVRTVIYRSGVVLSESGGALEKMAKPVKLGIGSALGSGKQIVPWIHIEDLCELFIKAIEDEHFKGIYNAVAPEVINNKEFTFELATILKKPFFMPKVPKAVLRMILGQMADLVLEGSAVSSDKILATGFQFKFQTLKKALKDLLGNN